MNIPELKLAMKQIKGEIEHCKDIGHMKPALKALLSACQSVCDVSDKMFPKREHIALLKREGDELKECRTVKDWENDGYNLVRSDDILFFTKKMMGLERVIILAIQDARTKGEFAKSPSLYFIGEKEVDIIADAIRQEMGVGK